jgi:hypothetical protein
MAALPRHFFTGPMPVIFGLLGFEVAYTGPKDKCVGE